MELFKLEQIADYKITDLTAIHDVTSFPTFWIRKIYKDYLN